MGKVEVERWVGELVRWVTPLGWLGCALYPCVIWLWYCGLLAALRVLFDIFLGFLFFLAC